MGGGSTPRGLIGFPFSAFYEEALHSQMHRFGVHLSKEYLEQEVAYAGPYRELHRMTELRRHHRSLQLVPASSSISVGLLITAQPKIRTATIRARTKKDSPLASTNHSCQS